MFDQHVPQVEGATPTTTVRGRFWSLSIATWAIAYAHAAALIALQYDRPGPLGPPYVLEPGHYLNYAISYEAFGLALISTPFLLIGALRCSDRTWAISSRVQIALLAL